MDFSIIAIFWQATLVVKLIVLLLLGASILSWALAVQKWLGFRRSEAEDRAFLDQFWTHKSLEQAFGAARSNNGPLAQVFCAAWAQYQQALRDGHRDLTEPIERVLRSEALNQLRHQERGISTLAIVASVSPFVGLLGTVWGIMHSFHQIGSMKSATLAVVAPGISEALVATALGLFVAIPAVVFYNIGQARIRRQTSMLEGFADDVLALLVLRS